MATVAVRTLALPPTLSLWEAEIGKDTMLILNPRLVVFGATTFPDVLLIAIDRAARRVAMEWSDLGPHVAFVDVPEQVVTVKLVHEVIDASPDGPRPGESAMLSFVTSPTGSDSGRLRFSAAAVVTSCTHEIVTSGRTIGTRRTAEFVLVSATGASDPISIVAATGGEP
jgi:hypothetical protein